MTETETETPASSQWVAAHANALLYEVLSASVWVGDGVNTSLTVPIDRYRAWRDRALDLAEIAAHPDYERES